MYFPIVFLCSLFDFDEFLFIPILVFITSKNLFFKNNIISCGYPKMDAKYKRETPFKQEQQIKDNDPVYSSLGADNRKNLNETFLGVFKKGFSKNLNYFFRRKMHNLKTTFLDFLLNKINIIIGLIVIIPLIYLVVNGIDFPQKIIHGDTFFWKLANCIFFVYYSLFYFFIYKIPFFLDYIPFIDDTFWNTGRKSIPLYLREYLETYYLTMDKPYPKDVDIYFSLELMQLLYLDLILQHLEDWFLYKTSSGVFFTLLLLKLNLLQELTVNFCTFIYTSVEILLTKILIKTTYHKNYDNNKKLFMYQKNLYNKEFLKNLQLDYKKTILLDDKAKNNFIEPKELYNENPFEYSNIISKNGQSWRYNEITGNYDPTFYIDVEKKLEEWQKKQDIIIERKKQEKEQRILRIENMHGLNKISCNPVFSVIAIIENIIIKKQKSRFRNSLILQITTPILESCYTYIIIPLKKAFIVPIKKNVLLPVKKKIVVVTPKQEQYYLNVNKKKFKAVWPWSDWLNRRLNVSHINYEEGTIHSDVAYSSREHEIFTNSTVQKSTVRSMYKFSFFISFFKQLPICGYTINKFFIQLWRLNQYSLSNSLSINITTMYTINYYQITRMMRRFIFINLLFKEKNELFADNSDEQWDYEDSDEDYVLPPIDIFNEKQMLTEYPYNDRLPSFSKKIKIAYRQHKFIRKSCLKQFKYAFAINNLKKIAQLHEKYKKQQTIIEQIKQNYAKNNQSYSLQDVINTLKQIKILRTQQDLLHKDIMFFKEKLKKYI